MTGATVNASSRRTADGRSGWRACPECGELLYDKRLQRNLGVCPDCGHHLRLPVDQRIDQLVDPGSFVESDFTAREPDPLGFTDLRPYPERLREAQQRSGGSEAVSVGTAQLGGHPIVLAVMNFGFLGGSMGVEVGRRVAGAAGMALDEKLPLIAVCASGGARMQEGVLSLVQMTRTSQAFGRLHEAGLLSVCVLTDPTYGGVSASFAALGALVIVERGAHVGFAGPRVVEQTIRQPLPSGFQTAEFLLAHGLVDRVESRADIRPLLATLVRLHQARAGTATGQRPESDRSGNRPTTASREPSAESSDLRPSTDPWQVVQQARDVDRPTTRDYLPIVFEDFVEIHGDRAFADDPALVAGIASVGGHSVVVLGQQKGHTVKDLVVTNFGMAHPEGYRKALRMLGHAERFRLPVVTLVDTPGAHPGMDAEERGQFIAIADMLRRLSRLRTPIVSVVTGEGGSGGALALCAADRLLMLEHSFLSVISPEGCAAILWRDAAEAPRAARALRLVPQTLHALGLADQIVPEPPGGAQADPLDMSLRIRAALVAELDDLSRRSVEELLEARIRRFDLLDERRLTP